jgi:8-oxo-dGTP pyrophosphatase MutT (NUDIX family)
MTSKASPHSYLELVEACDNFDATKAGTDLYRLYFPEDDRPHGIMRKAIVEKMPWKSFAEVDHDDKSVRLLPDYQSGQTGLAGQLTGAFTEIINEAIKNNIFEVLHGRHSEPYRIMGANHFVQVERFSHSLFGIASRGAHMTGYVKTSEGLKIWVPRRARHLFTYPGKLDSTVAGGIKAKDNPIDCIIAESDEEASLDKALVQKHLQAAGVLTYITMRKSSNHQESNLVSPEILYVYDLELPEHIILKPNDDEVEEFYLMSVHEVENAVKQEEFKTNSAIVMIDFFIRHGIITPENEPSYVKIVSRMHTPLPVATEPRKPVEY